jgi:hypothetical protein
MRKADSCTTFGRDEKETDIWITEEVESRMGRQ